MAALKFQLLVSYLQNCQSQQWKLLPQLLTKSVNLQQFQNQLEIVQQQVKDDLLTSSDVASLFLEWKDESFTVYIDTDHLTRPERLLLDSLKSLSASSVFLNTETTTMSSMIAAAEENADISKTEEVSDSLLDKLLNVGRTTEQPKKSSDWKTYSNMWMRPKPGGDSFSSSAQLAVLSPSGTLTLTTYHPDEKKQMILHVPISKSQLNLILKEVNPAVNELKGKLKLISNKQQSWQQWRGYGASKRPRESDPSENIPYMENNF